MKHLVLLHKQRFELDLWLFRSRAQIIFDIDTLFNFCSVVAQL